IYFSLFSSRSTPPPRSTLFPYTTLFRSNIYPEYCALLLAAKRLGRPVKWVGTRSEVFTGDEQARDIVHRGEMALDASGRILGMRSEEHTSELQSLAYLVCRLLLEKKKKP